MNEMNELNEGRRGAYWEHPKTYKYKSKASEMSTEELQAVAGEQGTSKYEMANFDRDDLMSDVKGMIKDFFKWDPFNMKEKFGVSFTFEGKDKSPEEFAYFDGRNKVRLFFDGRISSPIASARLNFDVEFYNGGQPQFQFYSDSIMNDWYETAKEPKVKEYFKKAYLAIPDSREEDKNYIMNKKGTEKYSWHHFYDDIPETFVYRVMEDPILWLTFQGIDEDNEYGPHDLKEIFNGLNKKYYKQWQKIHRKGIKGTLRNAKAWFISLKEHEEFNEGVPIIESFDTFVNEMYMGPADGKGSFDDHQKKQLGYNKDAVSAEAGGFGNGGNSGAPVGAVGEDGPTMMSDRLGDIEPEGYPSAAGQDAAITPTNAQVVSHNNMRGEPKLTNMQK